MVAETYETAAIRELESKVARPNAIGAIVLWWIPDNLTISAQDMRDAWFKTFDPSDSEEPDLSMHCPRDVSAVLAMSRAVRATHGRGSRRFVAKADEGGEAHYAPLSVRVDHSGGAMDLRTDKSYQAAIDKASGRVRSDDADVERRLQEGVDRNRTTFLGRDLSMALRQVIDTCQGIPLRPHGGDYFVPAHQRAKIVKLERIVQQATNGRGHVASFSVGTTPKEVTSLARAAHEALVSEIETLDKELEDIGNRVAAGIDVRASTIQERIAALRSVREKAQLYEEIASAHVGDVKTKVEHMVGHAKVMLGLI